MIIGFCYYKWGNKLFKRGRAADVIFDIVEEAEKLITPYYDQNGTIDVRMPDNLTGRIYDTKISEKTAEEIRRECGTLGRQWYRDNRKVFGINRFRDEEGNVKLKPIEIPKDISNAPSELHLNLQQPEIAIAITHCMKDDKGGVGEQIVKYLPWLVALGFLAFLFTTAS